MITFIHKFIIVLVHVLLVLLVFPILLLVLTKVRGSSAACQRLSGKRPIRFSSQRLHRNENVIPTLTWHGGESTSCSSETDVRTGMIRP
jgi:hypothetical protein